MSLPNWQLRAPHCRPTRGLGPAACVIIARCETRISGCRAELLERSASSATGAPDGLIAALADPALRSRQANFAGRIRISGLSPLGSAQYRTNVSASPPLSLSAYEDPRATRLLVRRFLNDWVCVRERQNARPRASEGGERSGGADCLSA